MKRTKKKIIAIESWNDNFNPKQKAIMKPLLQLLQSTIEVPYSYHYFYTPTELSYVLKNIPAGDFSMLYFAMHGEPSTIKTGSNKEFDIPLSQLADMMGERFSGYGVHFASCAVLNGWMTDLIQFKKQTGVSFISGFTKYVEFGSSSIVDLALFNEWAYARSYSRMFERLQTKYKILFEENGFDFIL